MVWVDISTYLDNPHTGINWRIGCLHEHGVLVGEGLMGPGQNPELDVTRSPSFWSVESGSDRPMDGTAHESY